jgi:hypothetical protein
MAWMFVCCECCVLSGKGVCDELITRPEESYQMCCVVVCDLETSRMRRPWPALGRSVTAKKRCYLHQCGSTLAVLLTTQLLSNRRNRALWRLFLYLVIQNREMEKGRTFARFLQGKRPTTKDRKSYRCVLPS